MMRDLPVRHQTALKEAAFYSGRSQLGDPPSLLAARDRPECAWMGKDTQVLHFSTSRMFDFWSCLPPVASREQGSGVQSGTPSAHRF